MKSFWTVVEKEISIDYSEQEILGLFNKKENALQCAETKMKEFLAEREGKRKGMWSEPVPFEGLQNGVNVIGYRLRSGCIRKEFFVTTKSFASDEDYEA